MIFIIDYGAGNLRSVVNAITKLGYQATIASNPDELTGAKAVILPGVGSGGDTMANLKKMGFVNPIKQLIADDRPFFGVCIGLQVLFTSTDEGGWHECLNVIPGRVKKLPAGLKVPHMGWNAIHKKHTHPIFKGIPDQAHFYFVHSYYAEPEDNSLVVGETDYGISFCSVVALGNLIATQFHPEKSGEYGLKIYKNFFNIAFGVNGGRAV